MIDIIDWTDLVPLIGPIVSELLTRWLASQPSTSRNLIQLERRWSFRKYWQQENQLYKVVDKNAELTIENCDLKKQVQELTKVTDDLSLTDWHQPNYRLNQLFNQSVFVLSRPCLFAKWIQVTGKWIHIIKGWNC